MKDEGAVANAFILVSAPPDYNAVIPLLQDGRNQAAVSEDPHNTAIFNRWIASQPLPLHTFGDWMALPLLYLAMTGETPKIIDGTDAGQLLGSPLPNSYKPMLTPVLDGMVIEFYDYRSDADIAGWEFSFRADGQLDDLNRREGSRSALPRGRFR